MFLFDKYRSGLQSNTTGNKIISVRWKTFLNSNPTFAAESTATTDSEGNFYFGTHSGNFYSLDKFGNIRWSFYTTKKIYSSPVLIKNNVCFMGGDGVCYSLNKIDGKVIWKYDLKKGFWDNNKQRVYNSVLYLPYTFNLKRKLNMDTKSWSSPLRINDLIFVTGYGKGLYAINSNGDVVWSYDLGFPRYQLTGLVADENNNLYCISRSCFATALDLKGNVLWKTKLKMNWHPWGNPSFNINNRNIYFVLSKGEKNGCIIALNNLGKKLWETKLQGAIHGSVTIDKKGGFLYCADFEGYIYKIDAKTGNIVSLKKISTATRALWTTPTIDIENYVYISTKDSFSKGRVIKLDQNLNIIWEFHSNKTLSVPLILENGDVCFGSWDGYYYCLQTKER